MVTLKQIKLVQLITFGFLIFRRERIVIITNKIVS